MEELLSKVDTCGYFDNASQSVEEEVRVCYIVVGGERREGLVYGNVAGQLCELRCVRVLW